MSSSRYFIAIIIPSPLFEKVEAVKAELYEKHGLKGALRSPAHITLHRPFEWRKDREGSLLERLSKFDWKDVFEVGLNDFSFFAPRVVFVDVLPNKTLQDLYESLRSFAKAELKLFNEAEDERGFHPHVTVAFRDLKKRDFPGLKEEYIRRNLRGTFQCTGISLLRLEDKWREIRFFPFDMSAETV